MQNGELSCWLFVFNSLGYNSLSVSLVHRRRTKFSFNYHQFILTPFTSKRTLRMRFVQIQFLQAVYQSAITRCRMVQCRETILKMEEWSTNSTVIRGSVSMALLSLNVTKEIGMALHQAVSHMVSISESCPHYSLAQFNNSNKKTLFL